MEGEATQLSHLASFIVAHVCGDPLSRYACRTTRVAADFLRILGFFRCSSGIALNPPPQKNPAAPVALQLPGVSHVKLPLRRCRATGGCCLARSCRVSRRIFCSIFRAQTLTPKIDNACISEKPWPVPVRAAFAPR